MEKIWFDEREGGSRETKWDAAKAKIDDNLE